MVFNPNGAPSVEGNESVPTTENSMELDFTVPAVNPAEVADQAASQAKANEVAADLAKTFDSYDWDNPNQNRAGFK